METTTPVDQLGRLTLFRSCTRKELQEIDTLTTWVRAGAGRVLCREGEVGREFFVLIDGTATVSRGGRPLRQLTRGDGFGEIALLDRSPRSATVTTDGPTEVLVFNRAEFARLLDCAPRVARELLVTTNRRLREAEAQREASQPATGVPSVSVGAVA